MAGKRKKERAGVPRRYTFKLAPKPAQEAAMLEQCRMVAMLWNALLQRNEDCYRRTRGQKGVMHAEGPSLLTHFDMLKEITALRHECSEYRQFSSWTGNRVAYALDQAFKAFFRRAKQGAGAASGYPKFRSARRANWLPYIFYSGIKMKPSEGISEKKWRMDLPGIPGHVRAFGEFPSAPLDWTNADIRYLQGSWWLSVCVDTAPRRAAGNETGDIRFDLVDTFAHVEGNLPTPPSWGDILVLQDQLDSLKTERDSRFPRKPGQRPSRNWRRMSDRIGKLSARIARIRRERLHEWTTAVTAQASNITIIAPPVKAATQSAKGNEQNWGAAVDTVAGLNRHVLSQAPASAIAMLEYKAKEAGAHVETVEDRETLTSVGRDLSSATKAARKVRRTLKKESEYEVV